MTSIGTYDQLTKSFISKVLNLWVAALLEIVIRYPAYTYIMILNSIKIAIMR